MTSNHERGQAPVMTYASAGRRALPSLLFKNPNFIFLWAAYAISALGDHLSEMGLLEMQDAVAEQRVDSTRIQAILMFAFMAPFFLFSPVMGWLADRAPRKWIMITADVVRSMLLFSLFAVITWMTTAAAGTRLQLSMFHSKTGSALFNPWLYSVPLLVLGTFAAMFSPSRAAMLPTLVRTDQIVRANALTNALGPLMSIIAFALGGVIVTRYGVKANFRLNAITFLGSAAFILCIRPPARGPAAQSAPGNSMAGFRYVQTHHRILELVVFATIFWVGASAVRSVVPALVKSVFGGSLTDVGLYQATLGIGILIGALTLSALGDALKAEIAITWSLIFAGASVLWLALVAWASVGKAAGFAGLFGAGFFGAGVLVGTQALIQKMVPDRFRGRVLGVSDFFSMAGLLVVTGLLGIPDWPGIDRFVPLILTVIGVLFFVSGLIAVRTRLKRGRYNPWLNLWVNLNYLYCKAWHRTRRIGRCTIPYEGPVIVASNHISSLDPLVLVAGSPNRCMGFLIAREYYNVPVFSKLIRDIECVPVNRSGVDTASVKSALRHLEQGKMLGIFPQGGIRAPDDQSPPRDGVGLLALRSGATVVPAYISGIEYTKAVARPHLRRQRAVVRYGEPVDLSRWKGREKDREAFHEASEAIMAAIRGLAPEGDATPPAANESPAEKTTPAAPPQADSQNLTPGKV